MAELVNSFSVMDITNRPRGAGRGAPPGAKGAGADPKKHARPWPAKRGRGGRGRGGDRGARPAGGENAQAGAPAGAPGDAPAPRPKRRQHRGSGGSRRNKQLQQQQYGAYGGPYAAVPEGYAAPQYYAQAQPQWYAPPPWDRPPQQPRERGAFELSLTPHATPTQGRSPRSNRKPTSCCPTPNSDAKLRRNLDEIYSSVDVALMNHAFEAAQAN